MRGTPPHTAPAGPNAQQGTCTKGPGPRVCIPAATAGEQQTPTTCHKDRQPGESGRLAPHAPRRGERGPAVRAGHRIPTQARPCLPQVRNGPRPPALRAGVRWRVSLSSASTRRPLGAQEKSPGQPHSSRRQPARAYATGLVPGSPTKPSNVRNTGTYTGHNRHRKARADPYLVPALRHSDSLMAEPTAPRNTRPRSPTLDEAHVVIRALGLQSRGRGPPQEDTDSDSDLDVIPTAPAHGAPAARALPADSIQALCPAWKRSTAPERAGAPGNTPGPPQTTGHHL